MPRRWCGKQIKLKRFTSITISIFTHCYHYIYIYNCTFMCCSSGGITGAVGQFCDERAKGRDVGTAHVDAPPFGISSGEETEPAGHHRCNVRHRHLPAGPYIDTCIIYMHMYICMYLYLSIYLSVYPSIYLSIYRSISLYIYIHVYVSVRAFIHSGYYWG